MAPIIASRPGYSKSSNGGVIIKTVTLRTGQRGLSFRGECPCVIAAVGPNGVASRGGLKPGDRLLRVNDTEVGHWRHDDVVRFISISADALTLTVESLESDRAPGLTTTTTTAESSMDSDTQFRCQRRERVQTQLHSNSLRRRHNAPPLALARGPNVKAYCSADGLNHTKKVVPTAGSGNTLRSVKQRRHAPPVDAPSTSRHRAAAKPKSNIWRSAKKQPVEDVAARRRGFVPQILSPPQEELFCSSSSSSHSRRRRRRDGRERRRPPPPQLDRSASEPDFFLLNKLQGDKGGRTKNSESMIAHADSDNDDSTTDDTAYCVRNQAYRSSSSSDDGSSSSTEGDEEEENARCYSPVGDFAMASSSGVAACSLQQWIVVYLGAVPLPSSGPSRGRRQAVHDAVVSLLAQQAKGKTVLLRLFKNALVVNHSRRVMTRCFALSDVVFCIACGDNPQFFGVTVSAEQADGDETLPLVCHVFAADPQLNMHAFHFHYAKKFDIKCSKDAHSKVCAEFPFTSTPIVSAISCKASSAAARPPPPPPPPRSSSIAHPPPIARRPVRPNRVVDQFSAVGLDASYASSTSDSGIAWSDRVSSRSSSVVCPPPPPTRRQRPLVDISNDVRLKELSQDEDTLSSRSGRGKTSTFTRNAAYYQKEERNQNCAMASTGGAGEKRRLEIDRSTLLTAGRFGESMKQRSLDVPHSPPPTIASPTFLRPWSQDDRLGEEEFVGDEDEDEADHFNTGTATFHESDLPLSASPPAAQISLSSPALATPFARPLPPVRLQAPPPPTNSRHLSTSVDQMTTAAGGSASSPSASHPPVTAGSSSAGAVDTAAADAQEFDANLLNDSNLRRPFEEFLQQQFCHENLNFWLGVERYRSSDNRAVMGREIFQRHFEQECPEPVNVDSAAINKIAETVPDFYDQQREYPTNLFDAAQYQIFHLLKYDVWPRFLKWQAMNVTCPRGDRAASISGTAASSSTSLAGLTTNKEPPTPTDRQKKRRSFLPTWKNIKRFSRKEPSPINPLLPRFHQTNATVGGGNRGGTATGGGSSRELGDDGEVFVGVYGHTSTHPVSFAKKESTTSSATTGTSSTQPPVLQVSSTGVRRKQQWKQAGKQFSVPVTLQHYECTSGGSATSSQLLSRPDVVPESDPAVPLDASPTLRPTTSATQPPSPHTCTVMMPGGEKQIIPIAQGVTVAKWVHRLGSDHGVPLAASGVTDVATGRCVEPSADAVLALKGRLVQVEKVVLFNIDLPPSSPGQRNRQLTIRSRNAETPAGVVLRPLLMEYGVDLDKAVVCFAGPETNEILPAHAPIQRAHNRKLLVMSQQDFQDWVHSDHHPRKQSPSSPSALESAASGFRDLDTMPDVGVADRKNNEAQRPTSAKQPKQTNQTKAGPGMFKFVSSKKVGKATSPDEDDRLRSGLITASTLPARRKSIGPIKGVVTTNGSRVEPLSSLKRQTFANPAEFRAQLQQDKALGQLLNKAQASRLDDQRSGDHCTTTFELPDFLKNTAADESRTYEDDGFGPPSALHDLSGTVPNQQDADAVFYSPVAFDKRAVEGVLKKCSNVSLVRVDSVDTALSGGALPTAKRALSPRSCYRGRTMAASCRGRFIPPPIYASSIDSSADARCTSVNQASSGWQVDFV